MARGYVELHAHSAFSFGDGASLADELALAAAEAGQEAIALTDHDGVWGSMEFAQACRSQGVRPITGAELTVTDGCAEPFHLTLLVSDATGYRNLCRLVTEAHRDTRPHPDRDPLPPILGLESLLARREGLVCLSGCARDGALAGRWERREAERARSLGDRLMTAFGPEHFRVELQRPFWRHDRARNRWLERFAGRLGVPCVATGNVHMHHPSRAALQDTLVAVRLCGSLEETEPQRRANSSSHLASADEMAVRFRDHPEAVQETARLAERLRFDLTRENGYRYPGSEDPGADHALAELCRARLEHRYAGLPEHAEAARRLEEELALTRKLGLSGFFLLHHDILELAREVAVEVRGRDSTRMMLPPGRGRGSSVSSVVCYLTGLSHIDPVRNGLFLGRFLNEEIADAPDIDLDFPRDIRERLIPRIHGRYGPERSALVAAFACYRSRSAVRDFGKALGLPPGEIERVARTVDMYDRPESVAEDMELAIGTARARSGRWRALAALARDAWGLPRHASQHPGGMVLSTRPLVDICPVQPAAMEGRQIVQWDKDSCADGGFLKIDLLGLGMLSAVERCVDEIARVRGEPIDLSRIPIDDAPTYEAIQRAETTGVFQIESRAQMQMLPRTLPKDLDDLTVQVALVRPGPIQGGAVHPYLQRKKALREDPGFEVPYAHPSLKPILADTLGTIIFQEQVIQVAMAMAGFSAGEAEGLRRAMSRKRSEEALEAHHERFVSGAIARGASAEVAEEVFSQVVGFSGFGFPKAHAAAFGLLAYQSTWLRVHYGPEFLCALLNEQPMGFYPPDALVHEARRRGLAVRPPEVNRSAVGCRVEDDLGVRIGLGYINGVRAVEMEATVAERERAGPYEGLADLVSRSGAGRDGLEKLAWAGALEALGVSAPGAGARGDSRRARSRKGRRADLWRVGVAQGKRTGGSRQLTLPLPVPSSPPLRALGEWEEVVADYASTGLTLGTHPMELVRPGLAPGLARSEDLEEIADGSRVQVAGMVVARQRPATARGVVFMLLEDEVGVVNLVVLPPAYERYRLAVRTASFIRVTGKLERREGITNVVVSELAALATPDAVSAPVRHIEPAAELEAVAPKPHSFGRRA
ncbi:MAG: DNA polymerase III subunit alpha [Solirubrobacterales bacterium]